MGVDSLEPLRGLTELRSLRIRYYDADAPALSLEPLEVAPAAFDLCHGKIPPFKSVADIQVGDKGHRRGVRHRPPEDRPPVGHFGDSTPEDHAPQGVRRAGP